MERYEVKVWHRGWADWAWRVRYNDHGHTTILASGSAPRATTAKEAAADVAALDAAERKAKWVEL